MLEIGSLVDGKYKILNKIGQGGMSVVYLAMNERANKQWAIKEVRKDGVSDYETVKQGLVAETDILKRLSHEHLPSIIDVIDCSDTFLIVMDYIEGKPLSEYIKESGAQPQERVVEWGKQICDVLGYLHSRKPPIIYRDLKPSNVMLKPDGNIMIIDFGTAREFKESSVEDTKCLGTMGYAAPEQYGGHGQTDARTDIYCLGTTMYHLLTGHNPAQPPYEMYPIRRWNPQLSSGLEEIILKCTQKNPDDRYQSCAELMYALDHYSELDHEYRRSQNRKFKAFVTSVVLMAFFAAGAFIFKMLENGTSDRMYDSYITNAETSQDSDAKVENYINAINLKPSFGEAYNNLLNELTEDNVFTQKEANQIVTVLNYSENGKANSEYFATNEEEYDEFAWNLGLDFFYLYGDEEGGGKGNRQMAQKWFQIAKESTTLSPDKVKAAEYFEKISGYYNELSKAGATGYSKSEATYKDYWQDMTFILDSDLSELGNDQTVLVIYRDFTYQLLKSVSEFKATGVSQTSMTHYLELVDAAYQSIGDAQGLKDEIEVNIEKARENVDMAFSNTITSSEDDLKGGE